MKHCNLLLLVGLLASNATAQVFPNKPEFDRYGGYHSYKRTATGRFHLEKFDGRHLLVTPQGHGFVSIGVTHTGGLARPQQSKVDYFDRQFMRDWTPANAEILANFRRWGYNSLGYDSHQSTRELLPHFASCQPTGKVSSWMRKQVVFPDVFSKSWKAEAQRSIENMLKQMPPSPNLIGIYWTDMPAWDLTMAKRTAGSTWVDAIRNLPQESSGRVRYEEFLRENGEKASDEDFLVLIAREVYSFIGPLTRELAPNTLVFGERYAGGALPWRVIQEALPWIDVVTVQPDATQFPAEAFEKLYLQTQKPVMICDHQSSFRTPQHANVMWRTVPDVAAVAEGHASYLEKGFATPYLIGYHRCQYIDRYIGQQEILKQGLLQVDGRPYEALVQSVSKNNWLLHQRFHAASDDDE